jgi:hypothetical protein
VNVGDALRARRSAQAARRVGVRVTPTFSHVITDLGLRALVPVSARFKMLIHLGKNNCFIHKNIKYCYYIDIWKRQRGATLHRKKN